MHSVGCTVDIIVGPLKSHLIHSLRHWTMWIIVDHACFYLQILEVIYMESSFTLQFPWMQVSKSRALLMMVKPEVFVSAVGMGM